MLRSAGNGLRTHSMKHYPVLRAALRGVHVRELLAVEGLAPAARGVGGAPSPDVEGGGLIY